MFTNKLSGRIFSAVLAVCFLVVFVPSGTNTANAEVLTSSSVFANGSETILSDTVSGPVSQGFWGPRELGTVFSAKVSGTITHIQVYCTAEENGVHSASIWRSDGVRVAGPYSLTYGGIDGWFTIDIPDIDIVALKYYTVSVSTGTDAGSYFAMKTETFNKLGSNGKSITWPAHAGVYSKRKGTMPKTQALYNAYYYRDIIFVPFETDNPPSSSALPSSAPPSSSAVPSSAPPSSSTPPSSSAPPSSAPPSSSAVPPSSSAVPSSAPPSSSAPLSSSAPTASSTIPSGDGETMFVTGKPTGAYLSESWKGAKELGNVFKASVSGDITAVRYYKAADETGAHNVRIWNKDTSTCIAGPFSFTPGGSAEGWYQYDLATPVSISANVNYIVSVSTGTAPQSVYGVFKNLTNGGNNSSYLSWPAWGNNGNGLEAPLGSMPNVNGSVWDGNYMRDIVFVPVGGNPPSSSAPASSSKPASSSTPPVSSPPASSAPVNSSTSVTSGTTVYGDPESLFTNISGNIAQGYWGAKEYGTIFSTAIDGKITHIKVYSTAQESGVHTARIWRNSDNVCIAGPFSLTFGGMAGWVTCDIPDLYISENVNYTVSVTTGQDTGTYVAMKSNITAKDGYNGSYLFWPVYASVYTASLGTRPTTAANYDALFFRDVIFQPAGVDPTPPETSSVPIINNPNGYGITYSALTQEYADSPPDNPLKGFLPYKGIYTTPYSMEWWYIPFCDLMNNPDSYTFNTGLEPLLNEVSARGHQVVFRPHLDYPLNYQNGVQIPQFMWDMGIKKIPYTWSGGGVQPDWKDQRLIDILDKFIHELGKRYDGDPRIGYIATGLIGHWGECHTYPSSELMPSDAQMNQLFKAWDISFNKTKLVTRYPDTAAASSYHIGFNDDSFTEDTIVGESWHFMTQMASANATNKWKTEAIGGEFRPEGQVPFLNGAPVYSDYTQCVDQTHATWLIYHYAFDRVLTTAQLNRIITAEKQLGYNFTVTSTSANVKSANSVDVNVKIDNKGVAPFYYDWKVKIAILNSSNSIVKTYDTTWKLTKILPNAPIDFVNNLDISTLSSGSYSIVMSVENPLANGHILKFANTAQDANVNGWVTLASISKS